MTSHLVVTSDDEGFVLVARHISDLLDDGQARTALQDTAGSSFYSECETLITDGKFDALLDKFIENFDTLFAKAADGDIETCLYVCVHLLPYLDEYAPEGIEKLSQAVRAKVDDHVELRLSALVQIFNVADDSRSQYKILLDAVAFAKASSQSTLLAPAIRSRIDTWVEEWQLTVPEQQRLYLAVADLFRANKKRKALIKEAYKLATRALSTMEDASREDLGDMKQLASTAVADFIRSPDVFQFDLLQSPVIRQLEGDPQDGELFQLLNIVIDGDVEGLEGFLKASSATVESAGLSSDDLLTKTRLMGLLALAASANQVSYPTIQEHLRLSDGGEVEEWLVRAMGKKLIEGQMDQVKQQVTVTKASHRTFGPEDWDGLQKQLDAWKVSVDHMKDLVRQNNSAALGAAPFGVRA